MAVPSSVAGAAALGHVSDLRNNLKPSEAVMPLAMNSRARCRGILVALWLALAPGLGKTAALYYYPYEDHGPATEETILDLWARWVAWLATYVKNGATAAVTN